MEPDDTIDIERWVADLEARHLADLTFAEVRRALQALSSLYVARRERLAAGGALDGAGKRAAFACYLAPLHLLLVRRIVDALGAATPVPSAVIDLGCGTGPAGAAWALAAGRRPEVRGVDRSRWAVAEARWNLGRLGLRGRVRCGDLEGRWRAGPRDAVVAAFVVNEIARRDRDRLLARLLEAAHGGSRVLVVEPIAKGPVPWWPSWAGAFEAVGGRQDKWQFPIVLPEGLRLLGKAAGLRHRAVTGRSLWHPGFGPRES